MKKGLHKCTMKNEYMLYEYIHSNPHLAPTEVREQKFAITCSMCIDCHKFRWTNSGAILALDTRVYAYKYKYIYICVCREDKWTHSNILRNLMSIPVHSRVHSCHKYQVPCGPAQCLSLWCPLHQLHVACVQKQREHKTPPDSETRLKCDTLAKLQNQVYKRWIFTVMLNEWLQMCVPTCRRNNPQPVLHVCPELTT